MFNKLLERQLNRFIKNRELITPEWKLFIEAVNHSYEHYELDHQLVRQSLELSSNELREYLGEVQEREERIRAILEAASDGIIVVNQENKIVIFNKVAADILLIKTDQPLPIDISSMRIYTYDNLDSDDELVFFADILSKTKPLALHEISIPNPNGSRLPVEISISKTSATPEKLTICILRDISDRKKLELKANIRTESSRLLLESASLEEGVSKIVSKIGSEFGWNIGSFLFNHPEIQHPRTVMTISPQKLPKIETLKRHLQEIGSLFQENTNDGFLRFTEPYFCADIEKTSYRKIYQLLQYHVESYLLIPIGIEKSYFGKMEFFSSQKKEKDDQLINIFANIGVEIGMFIERQLAINREFDLQKQLVEAARKAGMMQIATSVLHNVGNALSTVNTSVDILRDKFINSELNNIIKIGDLIHSHQNELSSFITSDPKGRYLPEYLISMGKWWEEEHKNTLTEFERLKEQIELIKKIISSQQSQSRTKGTKEKLDINGLLDDLLYSNTKDFTRFHICVVKDYCETTTIEIDRVKLLQILANLFNNAIQAVNVQASPSKTITIKTKISNDKMLDIHIIDNGCGIDSENISKIFTYGFTTKEEGHGFGLHSSAVLARELDGELSVKSPGLGLGSEFILSVPINSLQL